MVSLYAVISKASPRYDDWVFVFGSDRVPVKSATPFLAMVRDGPLPFPHYRGDLTRVTAEQRQRLIAKISDKWELEPAEVERDLDDSKIGLAILAEDVTIVVDERMGV